jgi:hypothetical protein
MIICYCSQLKQASLETLTIQKYLVLACRLL